MRFYFDCTHDLNQKLLLASVLALLKSSFLFAACCRSVDAVRPTQIPMITMNQFAVIRQAQHGLGGSAQLTVCGHAFCKNCLSSWLQIKPACPSCRFDLLGRIERPLKTEDLVYDTKCTICWDELRIADDTEVALVASALTTTHRS